jgi:hypothetical protein
MLLSECINTLQTMLTEQGDFQILFTNPMPEEHKDWYDGMLCPTCGYVRGMDKPE